MLISNASRAIPSLRGPDGPRLNRPALKVYDQKSFQFIETDEHFEVFFIAKNEPK